MPFATLIPLIMSLFGGQVAQKLATAGLRKLVTGAGGKATLRSIAKVPGLSRARRAVRVGQRPGATFGQKAIGLGAGAVQDVVGFSPFIGGQIATEQILSPIFGEPETGPSLIPEPSRPNPDVGFLLSALSDNADGIDPETLDRLMEMIGGGQQERRLI